MATQPPTTGGLIPASRAPPFPAGGKTLTSRDLAVETVSAAGSGSGCQAGDFYPPQKNQTNPLKTLRAFLTPRFSRLSSRGADPGSAHTARRGDGAHRVSGFNGWKKLNLIILFLVTQKISKLMNCFFYSWNMWKGTCVRRRSHPDLWPPREESEKRKKY